MENKFPTRVPRLKRKLRLFKKAAKKAQSFAGKVENSKADDKNEKFVQAYCNLIQDWDVEHNLESQVKVEEKSLVYTEGEACWLATVMLHSHKPSATHNLLFYLRP